MKQVFVTFLLVIVSSSALFAQQDYTASRDSSGQKVLTGVINESILANDPAFMWFYSRVNSYNPDPEIEKELAAYKDSFNVVAFVGTWDKESQILLPEFYKVVLEIGYPQSDISLMGVNHDMQTSNDAIQQFHITQLPTFIFLHDGKEIGRIEGNVRTSIEADMLHILQNLTDTGGGN
jgi:Thioredoxin